MKYLWFPFLTIAVFTFFMVPIKGAGPVEEGISVTKHNLSLSGPGSVKAVEETQICVFCHVSHDSAPQGPLWNRRDSGRAYIPYSSSTTKASPGQPTGASMLCLSCHDGTIAVGDVLSQTSPINLMGDDSMLSGTGLLEMDLSDDHPISFAYTEALAVTRGELVSPARLTGPVNLDSDGQMQCTACHDAHDNTFGKFLVMPNRASGLCLSCHAVDYWTQASHKTASATWNGMAPEPWPHTSWATVADNACENCHRPHSAGGYVRLLSYAAEEENCYACHNGNVAAKNIQAEFMKFSRHPVDLNTGIHDPEEPAVVDTRHVECVDCHNPHASKPGEGNSLGPLNDVRGVSILSAEISQVSIEYELCFRCHADSRGKPAPRTTRQFSQTNVRLEFNPANPSFHPIVGTGRNAHVPSLIASLTVNDMITCSDCHNNNAGTEAGGIGPEGPHGSIYAPILERQYVTLDNTRESSFAYALCYKCHSRSSILQDESFKGHRKHIVEENTSCNVCHDPHGISLTQGNRANNSGLINFDTSVVFPNSEGQLQFESRGTYEGICYLKCHNKDHNPDIIR